MAFGDPEQAVVALIFWLILPFFNGMLDWISLSVSRWFGQGIVAHDRSAQRLAWTLGLAILDLIAAILFLFAITWLLALGVEAAAASLGVDLALADYVRLAIAHPWSSGLWASIMVLSTLLPTAIHFVLALGAMWFAFFGNSLGRWCAGQLRTGNAAHYLLPELYLVFGWLVPVVLVPWLMWQGLTRSFALVEPLPDALQATALHAIALADAWLR